MWGGTDGWDDGESGPRRPCILAEGGCHIVTRSANPNTLTRRTVIWLTIASAIVTANAYYIHPIIAQVAEDFGVSAALVGAVPAFNQIALALGIFFLLPLGDKISNRQLATVCLSAQVVALLVMAVATSFWLFVAGSTVLGFFTVTPYLLPAYASKRVSPAELGAVTAMLTAGVLAGVLLSRTGAGVVGEYLGWRVTYWIAAALMLGAAIVLPRIMEPRAETSTPTSSYGALIRSLFPLVRQYPQVLVSGMIQGIGFASFLTLWMGIGLYLTTPEMGYGLDDVGYLAVFAAVNVFTTPRLGRWADRVGPHQARFLTSVFQLLGVMTLFVTGQSFWTLAISIVLLSAAGPIIDVSGRMIALNQAPAIRTRLMSIYIVMMFLGGGVGSWVGTIAFDLGGWSGTVWTTLALSLMVCALSAVTYRRER